MDLSYEAPLTERSYLVANRPKPKRMSYQVLKEGTGPTLSLNQLVADKEEPTGLRWFKGYLQPCVAEFIGTMLFIMVGILSIVNGSISTIATVHGFAIALLVASFGPISGGHFNPAVTIGVCLGGGIGPITAILYIISQLAGAMAGAGIVRGALSYIPMKNNPLHLTQYGLITGGIHTIPEGVPIETAIIVEVGITTVLVMTVLLTSVNTSGKTPVHPIAIGFAVVIGILVSIDISGGSMNPARSLGPAVVMTRVRSADDVNVWDNHWVYWAGPIGGATVAAITYRIIFG